MQLKGIGEQSGRYHSTPRVCQEMFPGRRDACASQVLAASQQVRDSPLQWRDCALCPEDMNEHVAEVQVNSS